MQINIEELERSLSEQIRPGLLNKENAILFINELRKNNIRIYGFDGFNVKDAINTSKDTQITDSSIQPNQDLSRDYSKYTQEQAYDLCLEYFYKDQSINTLYEISYQRNFV